ncbi:hypothetical protein JCM10908_007197 [Rhodotorula pacifica]|uniref:uncharacterized protein n=1 Tax=Rhodotorula pacifica TaxID=1495444 RepID=UPI0031761F67
MSTTQGTVHRVSTDPPLTAFEFASTARSATDPLLLFVAGLGDTLLSVPYLDHLASALDRAGWRCAQALLCSNGAGWGTSSVEQDALELAQIVAYYKQQGAKKVVLLGHSTGCQDAIAFFHLKASRANIPALDGVVLQAPVSDREAPGVPEGVDSFVKPIYAAGDYAPDAFVPPSWASLLQTDIGITYRRFFSLVLPPHSDRVNVQNREDFFSSDLAPDYLAQVFAPVDCPLLVALSGGDATYPEHVKAELPVLLERFSAATPAVNRSPHSCIIPAASHDLSDPKHARIFTDTVVKYLQEL